MHHNLRCLRAKTSSVMRQGKFNSWNENRCRNDVKALIYMFCIRWKLLKFTKTTKQQDNLPLANVPYKWKIEMMKWAHVRNLPSRFTQHTNNTVFKLNVDITRMPFSRQSYITVNKAWKLYNVFYISPIENIILATTFGLNWSWDIK